MKIVSTAPYDTPTYDSFRREVDGLIAQIKGLRKARKLSRALGGDGSLEGGAPGKPKCLYGNKASHVSRLA